MENDKMNRRSFVEYAGIATTGLSAISGLGSAKGNNQSNIYEQSLFLRKKNNWSVHTWRKYLLKRGVNVKLKDRTVDLPAPAKKEDEVSSEWLTRDKLTIAVSHSYGTGMDYPRFDVDWEFKVCDGHWAEKPFDLIDIKWEGPEYDRQKSPYYGKYASEVSNEESEGLNGCVCEYNDAQHSLDHYYDNGDCYSFGSFFGTPLSAEKNSVCDRQIEANYYHTWPSQSYSIGWTVGAPVISFSSSKNKYVAETLTKECEMDEGEKVYTFSKA
ncbi:hypothetical protein [Halorussus salinus]|uniref:hypothetical protein n=1 Tax=Halorussus salinus TaxID=1364935 RepID=UPI001091A883|nr:hypothetical protein [Halorussus salinus]